MKKAYDHKKLEKKWQKEWAKKKIYKTKDPLRQSASSQRKSATSKKYYILDMFPYVSGEGIHVGHPKGYIATDVVSRMKRMQGFNVLHPMGFDAFGLPAENYAIKTKTNPVVSVAKNITRFKKQLEVIGFDYDWDREVVTSDPKYYKWTQWIFLKLLEKGLAYESNEPVNWCPKDKTVLANEDVEDGKCERCGTVVEKKPIRQWVLKITDYADRLLADLDELDWPESIKESQRNWIGRSEGAEIEFSINSDVGRPNSVKVFTTRPDTIFGATYVVLAPEHELVSKLKSQIKNWNEVEKYIQKVKITAEYQRTSMLVEKTGVELKGVKAINPATKEEIPIWIADYVLANYGTGAIMAVPAHDERDFEFAKKYNLPVKEAVASVIKSPIPEQAVREELPFQDREAVMCIVKHWDKDEYLCQEWKDFSGVRTFVSGGIEKGEDISTAGAREILEEAGYKNAKFIRQSTQSTFIEFYHQRKQVNTRAHFYYVYYELQDGEKEKISQEEDNQAHHVWKKPEEILDFLTISDKEKIWKLLNNKEEAYTGSGLLVNSEKFNGMDSEKAKKEITAFVGGKMVTKYKLRDWVFSRQRYWGEPIPVLFEEQGENNKSVLRKVIPVKEKDLPVKLPKVKFYEPTGTAESPLAGLPKWMNVKIGKKVFRRESNTMPQWAGSSWYYLRYMDPKNTKALVDKKKEEYWDMVDLYVGGAEHATRHLIYARFWHKFLYDIGVVKSKEPFKKLQHVGLIIASDGRKMSKRFGNIVSPENVIDTFGADTLRLYEMFMGPFDQSVAWSTESMIGPRRFLERVWKIASRIQQNFAALPASGLRHGQNFSASALLNKLLNKTIKKVTEDIEAMHFNTAVSTLMICANEMEKGSVSIEDYKTFLQLLAPFAPHITEEIWSNLKHKTSIHLSDWPMYDENKIKDEEVKIVIQVNGKVRGEMMISVDETEEEIKKKALENASIQKYLENDGTKKEIKKVIYVKNRLVNVVL